MNLKNHLNQQYPAVFIMALTIFDFKKDMSCPTSELRRFFLPHGGDRPKKKDWYHRFPRFRYHNGWMVIKKSPKKDENWGYPYDFGNHHFNPCHGYPGYPPSGKSLLR
jgi:hypothetical protein